MKWATVLLAVSGCFVLAAMDQSPIRSGASSSPLPPQAPRLRVEPAMAPPEQPDPPEILRFPQTEPILPLLPKRKAVHPYLRLWLSPEPMPLRAKKFTSATTTQSIYIQPYSDGSNWHHIDHYPVSRLEEKWRVSGGMEGLSGWKSDKYRTLPPNGEVKTWTELIPVTNRFGLIQLNKGIRRSYPDGTRFDDILSTEGIVFEHRVRRKESGVWKSEIIYENKLARPEGYTGLKVSCSSCHSQTGTGIYGAGLVPGADTIISDPLDWSAVWVKEPVE
jgi:hypothetical protein